MASDVPFQKFVSESELAEIKKKRQEEWEKVRRPDQPIEMPEEPVDNRSLYERLQEQKAKKEEAYAESQDLKNLVKGLDDEEVAFLDSVSKRQMDIEEEKLHEEKMLLAEYRNAVTTRIPIEPAVPAKKAPPKAKEPTAKSQKKLLAGVVKRKAPTTEHEISPKKTMTAKDTEQAAGLPSQGSQGQKPSADKNGDDRLSGTPKGNGNDKDGGNGRKGSSEGGGAGGNDNGGGPGELITSTTTSSAGDTGALKVIGILPGLGPYSDSSGSSNDSDCSSDDNDELLSVKVHSRKSGSAESH